MIGLTTFAILIMGVYLSQSRGGANPSSFADRHPRETIVIGYMLVAVATAIVLGTMTAKDSKPSRWVKALPGLLALAAINSLITLSGGHLLNTPSNPISRVDALIMTILFVGSALLLSTLRDRRLNLPDKVALTVFIFSFAWSVVDSSSVGLAVGFCCLVIASAYDRAQRHRRPDQGSSRPNDVTL